MSNKIKDSATLKRMAAVLAVPKSEIDAAERKRLKKPSPKRRRSA
jgi:hypothetical protein